MYSPRTFARRLTFVTSILGFIGRCLAVAPAAPLAPRLAAGAGAVLGIAFTGFLCHLWLGPAFGALYLIAPMGASAVLLFAVPASPLAQPWSVFGGNVVSALVGITCARVIPDPFLAAGSGVGAAIAAMAALRCIHPPGGAVALTSVLAWPSVAQFGYLFAVGPVAVNTAILIGTAVLFHRVSGRSYPHRADAQAPAAAPAPAHARIGFTRQDVANALRKYGDELDVLPQDLEALFHKVEAEVLSRHEEGLSCGDIMMPDPASAPAHTRVEVAAGLLVRSGQRALPVTDEAGHVLGLVGDRELTAALVPAGPRTGLLAFVKPRQRCFLADIMTRHVRQFTPRTSIHHVAQLLAEDDGNAALVCDEDGKLVGLITRQDVLAAVSRDRVEDMLRAG